MPADRDLTTGPVAGRLFSMSWPMVLGIGATMSVPIADSFFLGRLGAAELAAISFTAPVVLTLMSLAIGLGAGTASVVSRAVGEGDMKRVRRVATDAALLALAAITVVAVGGWLVVEPLFAALGAEGRTLALVVEYMEIWFIGLPPLATMMVASNLLRANGDAKSVSLVMIGAALLNLALDPVLIFGWSALPLLPADGLGIAGAAWATLVSRSLMVVAALWLVVVRDRLVTTTLPGLAALWRSWREVGRIALPSALGNATNPLGITVVTAVLATYGDDVVAGFGTAVRIETFVAIPMLAMSSAIGPIAGQNFGRGLHGRVRGAHRASFLFSFAYALAAALVLWFAAPWVAALFTPEAAIREVIVAYLRIVPVTLAGFGVAVVAAGGMNAVGEPLRGLAIYALRTVALYVPLATLAAGLGPPAWVFAAIAVANVAAGLAISWWALRHLGVRAGVAPVPGGASA